MYHSDKKNQEHFFKKKTKDKTWSGRQDLNLRPLAPHASALPGCATPRQLRADKANMKPKQ